MDRRAFLARCAVIPAASMGAAGLPKLVEVWCWTEAARRFWFAYKTPDGQWVAAMFANPFDVSALVERALTKPFV